MNPLTNIILHTLLDRLEQPQRTRVVRVRLNELDQARYFDTHDVQIRQEVNNELTELERQASVKLHWKKWQEGNWLESVDLRDAEKIYKHVRRSPRSNLTEHLLTLLDDYASSVSWLGSWHDEVRRKVQAGKAVAPFRLEDGLWNRDVLMLVKAVAELDDSTLERSLSVKLFKNSKWLESLRPALLSVLRRYAPDATLFEGNDNALLESFGLLRVPEYVLVSGSLVVDGVDISSFVSVGLPATLLRSARLESKAKRIVTIENQTSFESLAALCPIDTLLVFSGGFASPTIISLLRFLSLPLYHWGDIDVGGLRILAHLRSQLGTVQTVLMDSVTLEKQSFLQSLSEKECENLTALRKEPLLEDCQTLIDTMFDQGKLEQEALDARQVAQWLLRK
jgi:Uncharacterized protein conserved in bacteria C-term(DUF2220)